MIEYKLLQTMARGFLILSFVLSSAWANAANLKEIRVWHEAERTRIVMDMDEPPKYKRFFLAKPSRYVVDLTGFSLKASAPKIGKSGGLVNKVRVGVPKKNVARVVLDLNQEVTIKTLVLKPTKGTGHRLVFDVYPKKTGQKSNPKAIASADKKAPAGANKAKKKVLIAKAAPSKAPAANKPAKKGASVDAAPKPKATDKATQKPDRPFVIAIDAGHGGIDSGARGRKTREKDIVLQIAKRLKKKIDAQKGMRAVLTRDGDYFIKLRKRTQLAHKANADLFISIHADGFKNQKAKGSSVYALSLKGASSAEARKLAESENAADLIGGVQLAELDNNLAKIMVNLQMNSTQHESITFASSVLNQFKKIGKVHKSTVEKAGFMVLKTPDIPSILVETAFITNPKEEKLLRSAAYQEKLSNAILVGTINYLKNSNYHSARNNQ